MKISLVSDTITVIELSPEEMSQYDFTFEKSDYSSPHTRRVLWSIIDDAARIAGKTVHVSKGLEIDFLPDIKGGGLLIICEGEEEKIKGHRLPAVSIFQSSNIDRILDFAKSVRHILKAENSSLYFFEGTYRLCVRSGKSAFYFLSKEYCLEDITSPYSLESTKECWQCLIEEGALEILGGTASEK